MEHPLPHLARHVDIGKAELVGILTRSRAGIERRISEGVRKKRFAATERARRELYAEIASLYDRMGVEIDEWGRELSNATAKGFRDKAVADLPGEAGELVPSFSRAHAEKYWRYIGAPSKAEATTISGLHLAAAKTDQMKASDIRQLRSVVAQVFTEAPVVGWTGREQQRQLRDRILDAVDGDGLRSWQFIDRSGRRWQNANYFNMLSRTVPAIVARESYADAMLEAGVEAGDPTLFDLATIEGGGDPCPVCASWRGVIISLSGSDERFPSKQDALDAGVWHANCVCSTVIVDRTVDADAIAKQGGLPNPSVGENVKERRERWNEYANEVQGRAKDGGVLVGQRSEAMKRDAKVDRATKGQATKARKALATA